jgi:hypothetical protein
MKIAAAALFVAIVGLAGEVRIDNSVPTKVVDRELKLEQFLGMLAVEPRMTVGYGRNPDVSTRRIVESRVGLHVVPLDDALKSRGRVAVIDRAPSGSAATQRMLELERRMWAAGFTHVERWVVADGREVWPILIGDPIRVGTR